MHRYTGAFAKQFDTASSLILMGARPYDPNLGRFLAVDPVDGGSLNNYDYAAQDPVNDYDLGGSMLDDEAVVSGDDPSATLVYLYESGAADGSSGGGGVAKSIERTVKAALKGCAGGAMIGLTVGALGPDETGYGALAAAGAGCARGAAFAVGEKAAEASGVPGAKYAVQAVDWVTTGRDIFGAVGERLAKEGILIGWGIAVERTPGGARFVFGLVIARVR